MAKHNHKFESPKFNQTPVEKHSEVSKLGKFVKYKGEFSYLGHDGFGNTVEVKKDEVQFFSHAAHAGLVESWPENFETLDNSFEPENFVAPVPPVDSAFPTGDMNHDALSTGDELPSPYTNTGE